MNSKKTKTADKKPLVDAASLEETQDSLLDLVDNLLNRGVVVRGEVILGVAGVDLVYLQLNALLCAADRVLPALQKKKKAPQTEEQS